jgi:hypothetical protein
LLRAPCVPLSCLFLPFSFSHCVCLLRVAL